MGSYFQYFGWNIIVPSSPFLIHIFQSFVNFFHNNGRKVENTDMMRIIGDTLDGIIILIARQNIINTFILTNRVFISNVWSRFYEVFIKGIKNLCGVINQEIFIFNTTKAFG